MGDIHNQGLAHRDLKIENLLLDKDFNLKVADFGLVSKIRDEKGFVLLKGKCGTPEYMAPEVWSQGVYNGAVADIFSCGVILFLLMIGFPPFSYADKNKDALYNAIATKDYELFWEAIEESVDKTFNAKFKDLINSMLACDPNERPTLQEIQDHPWLKGPILNSEGLKGALNGLQEKAIAFRFEKRRKEKSKASC